MIWTTLLLFFVCSFKTSDAAPVEGLVDPNDPFITNPPNPANVPLTNPTQSNTPSIPKTLPKPVQQGVAILNESLQQFKALEEQEKKKYPQKVWLVPIEYYGGSLNPGKRTGSGGEGGRGGKGGGGGGGKGEGAEGQGSGSEGSGHPGGAGSEGSGSGQPGEDGEKPGTLVGGLLGGDLKLIETVLAVVTELVSTLIGGQPMGSVLETPGTSIASGDKGDGVLGSLLMPLGVIDLVGGTG